MKKKIKFDIITIFPEALNSYLNVSMVKRAIKNKLVFVNLHNLRDFAKDKHKKVDDRPYGGGPGMVLKTEPIINAIGSILKIPKSRLNRGSVTVKLPGKIPNSKLKNIKVILFAPAGKQFTEKMAQRLAKYDQLIMISGHYEGIDARTPKILKNMGLKAEEISVGPYVLTGGELAAMILIDSISRKIPGVLGKEESLEEKRHGIGIDSYTRPSTLEYKGKKYTVPRVLISGHHKKIEEWRAKSRKPTTRNSDGQSELRLRRICRRADKTSAPKRRSLQPKKLINSPE